LFAKVVILFCSLALAGAWRIMHFVKKTQLIINDAYLPNATDNKAFIDIRLRPGIETPLT